MSRRKARNLRVKFEFKDGDVYTSPAKKAAFNELVQLGYLYVAGDGDAISRKRCKDRLMDAAEAWIAWGFEEAQNIQNGFLGAAQLRDERQPVWDRWQARGEEIYAANPHLSKTAVCTKVAEEFGVSREAVGKRVSGIGKPRKSSK
ncbi:hypothetical protein NVV93_02715 [Pseudomonas sp. LS44]|uniref:hypothetical protein n=1 Tax=Pseudomonas sp. LS44 TaxID=1357074 RepID=UPI00215ABFD2|nr:hypothetical protein [Pseudomonas sp. LS44]UVE18333.1 hypothetical protein NVV93_02715 [Pseudomonas sp. LS44]